MSKKEIGVIPNNGDVHTAQIGFHIWRFGICVYVREYWKYKSWFIVPGVSVDAVNGYGVIGHYFCFRCESRGSIRALWRFYSIRAESGRDSYFYNTAKALKEFYDSICESAEIPKATAMITKVTKE